MQYRHKKRPRHAASTHLWTAWLTGLRVCMKPTPEWICRPEAHAMQRTRVSSMKAAARTFLQKAAGAFSRPPFQVP